MSGSSDGDAWAWIRLSEGLAGGIHHALNNRLAALGGAVQVLQGDIEQEHPMVGLLSHEVRRLETTTALLRLLGPGDGEPEPVQMAEILTQAERLFDVHHELRDLKLEFDLSNGLQPVWSVPVGLLRIVMMIIAAAGAGVQRGSALEWREGGVVKLEVRGDASMVRVMADVGARLDDAELPVLTADDVASMASRIGARLEVAEVGEGSRWELQLPTLTEARRREREGGAF